MKKLIYILLLIPAQIVLAQQVESVDKIVITYAVGEAGVYNGICSREESAVFLKLADGDFVLRHYLLLNGVNKNGNYSTDTLKDNVMTSIIAKKEIEQLLVELNTDKNNYTEAFIKPNLKQVSSKEIHAIVKKHHFKGKDTLTRIRTDIKNWKYLDEYLRSTPPSSGTGIDSWNGVTISFYSKSEEPVNYNLSFYRNITGQKIKISKRNPVDKKKWLPASDLTNLSVNIIIQGMVPKKSKLYRVIDLNRLSKLYVKWYVEEKV